MSVEYDSRNGDGEGIKRHEESYDENWIYNFLVVKSITILLYQSIFQLIKFKYKNEENINFPFY